MNRSKSRPVWTWIVALTLLAPVAYVLSLGPVARWMNSGDAPETVEDLLGVIYAPLHSIMEVPVVGEALLSYVVLWVEPEVAWEDVLKSSSSRAVTEITDSDGVERIGIDFDGHPGAGMWPGATVAERDLPRILSDSGVILTGGTQEPSARDEERRGGDADGPSESRMISVPGETTVERSHPGHTFQIAAPAAGRIVEDATPALIAKGDAPIRSMQIDGTNSTLR